MTLPMEEDDEMRCALPEAEAEAEELPRLVLEGILEGVA